VERSELAVTLEAFSLDTWLPSSFLGWSRPCTVGEGEAVTLQKAEQRRERALCPHTQWHFHLPSRNPALPSQVHTDSELALNSLASPTIAHYPSQSLQPSLQRLSTPQVPSCHHPHSSNRLTNVNSGPLRPGICVGCTLPFTHSCQAHWPSYPLCVPCPFQSHTQP
jgi:hypothetical protein